MRIPWGDPLAPLDPHPPAAAVPAVPAVPAGRRALTQPGIARTARTAGIPMPPQDAPAGMSARPAGIAEPGPQAPGRLLLALADRGITVTLEGEQVRLRPMVAVTPGLLAEVRARTAALVALLRCAGAVAGARVLTPKGPGLLRWRGYSGRLGVTLDGDPDAWHFFDPDDVQELPG